MRTVTLSLIVVLVLGLAACGSQPSSGVSAGDAAAGENVFTSVAAPACSSCHSLEPGVRLVGPSLAGIGAQAASRVPGTSAADYLSQSIREPDAYVAQGFAPGIMPGVYGSQLSDQQIRDLVAYLMTLK